ncbi:MAG TPA: RluA family pseudouridine synthase [Gemmatales bacterium]|nr:RluA family pseudouridine synthase [Gemmatales bacterium]
MKQRGEQLFHVQDAQAKQTLAALLRQWRPDLSWSEARELVTGRRVLVNGNLCLDPARRLQPGEVVKLTAAPASPPPSAEQVRIRHLDEHLVVVEKPAGITTMRHLEEADWPERRKQKQPTLDELLPRLIAREEGAGPLRGAASRRAPLPRVRPVHRLDRDTSGLMVFARTVEAERELGRLFKRHDVHRVYQAIVVGRLTEARTFDTHLVRDRGDKRRGSTELPQQGKRAVTHVRPLEALGGFTLVECRLETGRTHQIRIHLAEAGLPLAGEKVYDRPLGGPPWPDPSGAGRIMLHAAELGFEHPQTQAPLRFHMAPPKDFAELLRRLQAGKLM